MESGTPQNEEGVQGHIGPRPNLEGIREQLIQPGILYGTVTDAETDEPLEGVNVSAHIGFSAVTDENGYYRIDPIMAEFSLTLTATLDGYSDSTLGEIVVREGDSLEVNFALLHPEFVPSDPSLDAMLYPGEQTEIEFQIENQGNGHLSWRVEKALPGLAGIEPWDRRVSFFVGDSVDDVRIQGVVLVDNHFYLSGANDNHPVIYVVDNHGNLVDTFAQPIEDRRGMHDLAYDGELIWGAINDTVYGMTPAGKLMESFVGPYNSTTCIAWDPDRECLWLGGVTNDPVAYTRDGQLLDDLVVDRNGLLIYGLSYRENDPDGYNLYVQHENRDSNISTIHKVNIETGDTLFVAELNPERGGSARGAFITNQYDVFSWVFMNIADSPIRNGGDRIDVWQIESNSDWFNLDMNGDEGRVEAESGIINPDDIAEFVLTLDATDLYRVHYTGELHFWHNAAGLHSVIDVGLDVLGIPPIPPFDLLLPPDGDTLNSSIITFEWEECVNPDFGEIVEYELWLRSEEDSIRINSLEPQIEITIDTLDINIGYDSNLSWWVVALIGEDQIYSNSTFTFQYVPNGVNSQIYEIPVEFGLRSVYPNPFNSITTIEFGIEKVSQANLTIHDISGRSLYNLYNAVSTVGYHRISWDASEVPSGMYLLRMEAGERSQTKKVILLR